MIKNKKISELFEFLPKSKRNAKYGKEVGEYPFFASSNVVTKYVDEPDYTKNKLVLGDGGTASINYAEKDFSCSDHCYILKPLDEEVLNCKYVYWYLYSNLRVLEAGFKGIGIKNISKTYIQNVEIPVPSKEEQDNIVTILDKADEIRTKKRLANAKLDEFLKATFINMFGDPVKNENSFDIRCLKEFYLDDKSVKCGPFGSALKKLEYTNSGIPVWNMDNILPHSEFCKIPNLYITEKKYRELESYSVKNNDIIISRAGTVGKMCVVENIETNSIISTNLIRLRLNDTELLPIWFVKLLEYQRSRVCRLKTGADGAFTHMNTGILDSIYFPYPSIELQNKFAQIVEKVEAQKQKNEQVIEQMDNLFNSLSQRAFKGELTKSNVVDLLTRQIVLHSKIIDKCNSHQTFGAVKLEKIFNLCDMIQELNLVPGGYYRKAAGPYVPEMRHTVEQELLKNDWVKITNQGNGKKVEYKKDANFVAYKAVYNQIFNDKNQEIEKIIDYFYDKDTNYCEAFSTLYMCWNDLILEGKNPTKTEIIDEFKNHWAPEKQRFERIYLLEILSDMSNQGFEPQGHGVHTIESNYNHNKDQLSLQLK